MRATFFSPLYEDWGSPKNRGGVLTPKTTPGSAPFCIGEHHADLLFVQFAKCALCRHAVKCAMFDKCNRCMQKEQLVLMYSHKLIEIAILREFGYSVESSKLGFQVPILTVYM